MNRILRILLIPEKYCRKEKLGEAHPSKSITCISKHSASAILSLVLFCSFLLPQTALSQTTLQVVSSTSNPQISQVGITATGSTSPDIPGSGTSDPGTTDPSPTDQGPIEPAPSETDPTDPSITNTGTTDPGSPPPSISLPDESSEPLRSAQDNSSGTAMIGLGFLALLLTQYWDVSDGAEASLSEQYFGTPQSAYVAQANERGTLAFMESGDRPYRMWIRTGQSGYPGQMAGLGSGVSAAGNEVGMSWQGDEGFHVDASVVSNLSVSSDSLNMSADGRGYSISGGWRDDRYFARLRLSQSEFDTHSVISNPIVDSALVSRTGVGNTQVQFSSGMLFTADKVRISPSMSIQSGTFRQRSHVAHSAVLTAAVPGFSQDYTSVRLGLRLSAADWLSLSDSVKWKPRLQFDSIRTRSRGAKQLMVHQSDRAGVLGFSTGIRDLPEVVNSASFMAGIKSSGSPDAAWKFGFAGIEADGEVEFATAVGYQLKF